LTKDYVHIRGIGGQKTISVVSPLDLPRDSFQHIQTLYARGKCIINNLNFVIQGGRYASHGDDSGSHIKGTNAFATQIIANCRFEHKGNYMYTNGSAWNAICASTDLCLSSGSHRIFINDVFVSPGGDVIYGHNMGFHEFPSKLTMIGCSVINNHDGGTYPFITDIGCGHKTEVEIINCDFNKFGCYTGTVYSGKADRGVLNTCNNSGFILRGFGNKIALPADMMQDCWFFKTKNQNSNIEITGGTAFDDIWVDTQKSYKGATNAVGVCISNARICDSRNDVINYAYTLAYRLGNCASSPKTLIVEIDGTPYTITFNKNYMTSDGSAYTNKTQPYMSDADIISDINDVQPTLFECGKGLPYAEKDAYDDCKELGINKSTSVLMPGDAVKRLNLETTAWVKASANDVVDGVVAERIDARYNDSGMNKYNIGKILLLSKNLFETSFIDAPNGNEGDLYKYGTNGWEITTDTTQAQLINIGNNIVKLIK
jgi:hypothetical protein